eukprot:TRINITY_DN10893_c0_g1_i2.p1 TRINITY_DN10893_c0_g1~~TRINITY_DN10893_c0_g1_i2.p1  ORF type:complete len:462 (-),score=52.01 TRINITY_DN10893_c0_g1_i2:22-1353(-)
MDSEAFDIWKRSSDIGRYLFNQVFSAAKVQTVVAGSEVCKSWNEYSQADELWRRLCKRDFADKIKISNYHDWKALYKYTYVHAVPTGRNVDAEKMYYIRNVLLRPEPNPTEKAKKRWKQKWDQFVAKHPDLIRSSFRDLKHNCEVSLIEIVVCMRSRYDALEINLEVLENLLKAGANPNEIVKMRGNEQYSYPIEILLEYAEDSKTSEIALLLLRYGAFCEAFFRKALEKNSKWGVRIALEYDKSLLNIPDETGQTLCHSFDMIYAPSINIEPSLYLQKCEPSFRVEWLELFLSYGADVYATDEKGMSPLTHIVLQSLLSATHMKFLKENFNLPPQTSHKLVLPKTFFDRPHPNKNGSKDFSQPVLFNMCDNCCRVFPDADFWKLKNTCAYHPASNLLATRFTDCCNTYISFSFRHENSEKPHHVRHFNGCQKTDHELAIIYE